MKKLFILVSLFSFLFIGSFFYQKTASAQTTQCQVDQYGDPVCPTFTQQLLDCEGGQQVSGEINECGCQMPPKCEYPDETPSPDELLQCGDFCQVSLDCAEGLICIDLSNDNNPNGGVCRSQSNPHVESCTEVNCQTSADCLPGQTCYQPPMPECPAGMACIQVMPQKYCKGTTTLPDTCPIYDGKVMCPFFDPAPGYCDGGTLISQPDNECGCPQPPKCEYPEPSPSPEEITYCDTYQGPNDPSVCPTGYYCASVPPGGCGTGPNGEPLACATRPYCRLAEGISCESDDNCYGGYSCENGQCKVIIGDHKPPSEFGFYIEKQPINGDIEFTLSGPNSGYGVSAVLRNSNDQIVIDQSNIHYVWTSLNPEIVSVSPFSPSGIIDTEGTIGCTYGINLPCPEYNGQMSFHSAGIGIVRVQAFNQNGDEIASEEFTFIVKSKSADLNNDGKVNINDFTILSQQMMRTGNQTADLNQDGIVNIKDFTIMVSQFQVI